MATTFGETDVAIVVDRQEDVRDLGEAGQRRADLAHVGLSHEEEGHTGAEEDDSGLGIPGESLAFEIFLPECDVVVG